MRQAERGGSMKITKGRVRVAASDVANFLACQQLTQLDLLAAQGELRPPQAVDLGFSPAGARTSRRLRLRLPQTWPWAADTMAAAACLQAFLSG